MDNIIRINSGIKRYEVKNEHDEVLTTLLIDTNDTSIVERLANLIDATRRIYEENLEETKAFDAEAELTLEYAKQMSLINKKHTLEVIDEVEKLLGEGVFAEIFADNYVLNPEFVPDIAVIGDLLGQIIPIVEQIFGEKSKSAQKYAPSNKGKKTKTKSERIAELKAKEGESVE